MIARSQKYIEFNVDGMRKITVVDGQPYYQSTGQNSNAPGIWLPFIFLNDSKSVSLDLLPEYINKAIVAKILSQTPIGYIVKLSGITIHHQYLEVKHDTLYPMINPLTEGEILIEEDLPAKIPFKSTLIISSSLGGGKQFVNNDINYLKQAGLSLEEEKIAITPIQFEKNPEFSTDQASHVNYWLDIQGAWNKIYKNHRINYQITSDQKSLNSNAIFAYSDLKIGFTIEQLAKIDFKQINNLENRRNKEKERRQQVKIIRNAFYDYWHARHNKGSGCFSSDESHEAKISVTEKIIYAIDIEDNKHRVIKNSRRSAAAKDLVLTDKERKIIENPKSTLGKLVATHNKSGLFSNLQTVTQVTIADEKQATVNLKK